MIQQALSKINDSAYNLFFVFYAWLFAPLVIQATRGAVESDRPNIILGSLLLTGLVFETYFIVKKNHLVFRQCEESSSAIVGFSIVHILVSIVLGMLSAQLLGFDLTGKDDSVAGITGLAFTLRGIGILIASMLPGKDVSPDSKSAVVTDVFLVIFSWIAWSAVWDGLLFRQKMEWTGPADIIEIIAIVIVFGIFFSGFKAPYIVQMLYSSSTKQKMLSVITLVLVFVMLVYRIYF